MKGASILAGKSILTVDDEPDILSVLEEEIQGACTDCVIDKATTFEEASRKMASNTYDLVVLDIMGVRGFELLAKAISRDFKVAMLTAHALAPEALKRSFKMRQWPIFQRRNSEKSFLFLRTSWSTSIFPDGGDFLKGSKISSRSAGVDTGRNRGRSPGRNLRKISLHPLVRFVPFHPASSSLWRPRLRPGPAGRGKREWSS